MRTLNPLKQLAGQTATYGLSSIIGRLLNYFLVPIYTRVFTEATYGVVTEMYAYSAFFIVLLISGMETAFFRYSEKLTTQKNSVFSTAFLSVCFFTLIFWGFSLSFNQPLSSMLRYSANPEYLIYLVLIIGLDALSAVPFARLRAENKAKKFAFLKLFHIGLNIGLNLWFFLPHMAFIKEGSGFVAEFAATYGTESPEVAYVFISNLIASGLTFLLLCPEIFKHKLHFDTALWKTLIRYGFPLLIAGMAGISNETLDRILLKYLLPQDIAMAELGIYGACYKVSILISVFIQAFRYAAEPFFFAQEKNTDARKTYASVMNYFVIIIGIIMMGILMYLDVVIKFVGEEFRIGVKVVPILLLANVFLGIFYNLSVWYKLKNKTIYGAALYSFGALITVVLNIIWIPIYGYVGSAWATLICYAAMAVGSYFIGRKIYPIPYNIKKIFLYIGSAIGLYLISTQINFHSFSEKMLVNSAFLILYLLIIIFSERKRLTAKF